MSVNSNLIVGEATNLKELMNVLHISQSLMDIIKTEHKSLILFVAAPKKHKRRREIGKEYAVSKSIEELSKEAEENVQWVLEQYLPKLEEKIMFVKVKLKPSRWRSKTAEFRRNNLITIKTVPTLRWFGDIYALEGADTSDLMLIKDYINHKLQETKMDAKYLFPGEDIGLEESSVEFACAPEFKLEFWDLKVAAEADKEAHKRLQQVQGGLCPYDVMLNAFLKMGPNQLKKFLKELDEAESRGEPYNVDIEEEPIDVCKGAQLELELLKPNVNMEVIQVERDPTPKQLEEVAEAAKVEEKPPKPPKEKKKDKKGKGKEKKGKGKGDKKKKKK